jgi:hypothetical protein
MQINTTYFWTKKRKIMHFFVTFYHLLRLFVTNFKQCAQWMVCKNVNMMVFYAFKFQYIGLNSNLICNLPSIAVTRLRHFNATCKSMKIQYNEFTYIHTAITREIKLSECEKLICYKKPLNFNKYMRCRINQHIQFEDKVSIITKQVNWRLQLAFTLHTLHPSLISLKYKFYFCLILRIKIFPADG